MNQLTRRKSLAATPGGLGGAAGFGVSPSARAAESYEAATARIWRSGPLQGFSGAALSEELVRYATLAPYSHNTQCWKFVPDGQSITIVPDLLRQCPVVDPDDHHLYVSLGCTAENLVQAAQAMGLAGDVRFDAARDAVVVRLSPTPAVVALIALCGWAVRTRRTALSVVLLGVAVAIVIALSVSGLKARMLAVFAPDAALVVVAAVILLCLPAALRAWAWACRASAGTRPQPP